MTRDEAKNIVEVLLFVSDKPLSLEKITEVLDEFDKESVSSIIEELNAEYQTTKRSFSIVEVGGGFQILTDQFYAPWVRKLFTKDKAKRLSMPSLETLAIIAYKQPVTRADIEAIRGVNTEGVLDTLLERGLIRLAGRKEVIGRPFLYSTTRDFLVHFGLKSLENLPKLNEYTEGDIQLGRDELIKKESGSVDEPRAYADPAKTQSSMEVRDEETGKNVEELTQND